MKENGLMIKLMALVSTLTWMVLSTLDSGKKISSMVRERRAGLMVQCMKETIFKGRNKVRETSSGQTAQSTLDSSSTIILRALENTDGLMEEDITANGAITRCMAKVYSRGPMAENMKENTLKTRNRD
jgi:hypothetical protein